MKRVLICLAASLPAMTAFAAPPSNLTPDQQNAMSVVLTCGVNYGHGAAKDTRSSASDIALGAVYACSNAFRSYFAKFPDGSDSASQMSIAWFADWQFRGAVADAVLHARAGH